MEGKMPPRINRRWNSRSKFLKTKRVNLAAFGAKASYASCLEFCRRTFERHLLTLQLIAQFTADPRSRDGALPSSPTLRRTQGQCRLLAPSVSAAACQSSHEADVPAKTS